MELDNCRLGGDFRILRHAEICQFDRFYSEINFKRVGSCNYGIPRLVQVKMKILNFAIVFKEHLSNRVTTVMNKPETESHELNLSRKPELS